MQRQGLVASVLCLPFAVTAPPFRRVDRAELIHLQISLSLSFFQLDYSNGFLQLIFFSIDFFFSKWRAVDEGGGQDWLISRRAHDVT